MFIPSLLNVDFFNSKFTRRARFNAIIGALLLAGLGAMPTTSQAQESYQDQLDLYDRDDIHSIHRKLYTKEGRHEFGFGIGGIFNNDGFGQVSLNYQYHLYESLAIEAALGGLAFKFDDDDKRYFYQASAVFSPLYGKVSLFTWAVMNFDIYAVGGAGFIKYTGLTDGSSLMGNIGVGQRFFINEFLSAKVEFRNNIYKLKMATGNSHIQQDYSLAAIIAVMFPFRQKY